MTTIDQRILIPAPPDAVWDYISRLDSNPTWQVDCESLTFLSQKHDGVGTRWRQRSVTRQEVVYEITTWYNGLGYEYVFIDGSAFQSSKGRIRLQEIPEGTIVQWTFSYELSGVFGGLRNALTTQRRIESDMVDSLKTLWKVTKRQGSLDGYQARSLMRDGPQSPEERAIYQPRHDILAPQTEAEPESMGGIHIPEPPISDEDTRPGRAVQVASAGLNALQSPREDDNRFAPPEEDGEERFAAKQDVLSPSNDVPPPLPEDEVPFAPTAPLTSSSVEPQAEPKPDIPVDVPSSPDELDIPTEVAPTHDETVVSEPLAPPTDLTPQVSLSADTSGMSIWEVFGIPSPTDTQRMRAIQAAEQAEREYTAEQIEEGRREEDGSTSLETVESAEVSQEQSETAETNESSAEQTQSAIATTEAAAIADSSDENDLSSVMGRVDTIKISDEFSPQSETGRNGFRAKARSKMVRVRRPGT